MNYNSYLLRHSGWGYFDIKNLWYLSQGHDETVVIIINSTIYFTFAGKQPFQDFAKDASGMKQRLWRLLNKLRHEYYVEYDL